MTDQSTTPEDKTLESDPRYKELMDEVKFSAQRRYFKELIEQKDKAYSYLMANSIIKKDELEKEITSLKEQLEEAKKEPVEFGKWVCDHYHTTGWGKWRRNGHSDFSTPYSSEELYNKYLKII